jgi:hypothetical protein
LLFAILTAFCPFVGKLWWAVYCWAKTSSNSGSDRGDGILHQIASRDHYLPPNLSQHLTENPSCNLKILLHERYKLHLLRSNHLPSVSFRGLSSLKHLVQTLTPLHAFTFAHLDCHFCFYQTLP